MAKRRTKKDDMLAYPYTPERQLEHPSGWCMTNDHNGCRYQFNHGKCGCDCHTSHAPEKKRGRPRKVTQEVTNITNEENDPRPWRKNG